MNSKRYKAVEGDAGGVSQPEGIGRLIPVIDGLRAVFAAAAVPPAIDLPQIVVVGDQSAGKSSVLESFVAEPILPRGTGMVTKCPIVLQLINVAEIADKRCELLGKSVTDFSLVPEMIREEMDARTGKKGKSIVREEIVLTVYSPHVVTLTLVDLPGIVKIASKDLPQDIERQIEDLILYYIQRPKCIILAISVATTDLVAAECMKLALKVDPSLDRTIVVRTKLDQVGSATGVKEAIRGEGVEVQRGIVGVVNRSQDDISTNKTIQYSLEKERSFLEKHCPDIAARHGTRFLARQLSFILADHIAACLPDLERSLAEARVDCEKRARSLEAELDDKEKLPRLLELIRKFCANYAAAVTGRWGDASRDNEEQQSGPEDRRDLGGAEIRRRSERVLTKHFGTVRLPKDEQIMKAVLSSVGYEEVICARGAFVELTKRLIQETEDSALLCADNVIDLVKTVAEQGLRVGGMERFPQLKKGVQAVLDDKFQAAREELKKRLMEFIQCKSDFVDMDHEDWVHHSVPTDRNNNALVLEGPLEERAKSHGQVAKHWIHHYMSIYLKGLKHEFRTCLAHYVVFQLRESLPSALIAELHRADRMDSLMQEKPEVVQERQTNQAMLKELEKAAQVLKDTRRFCLELPRNM